MKHFLSAIAVPLILVSGSILHGLTNAAPTRIDSRIDSESSSGESNIRIDHDSTWVKARMNWPKKLPVPDSKNGNLPLSELIDETPWPYHYDVNRQGQGSRIYILDTGVRRDHDEFSNGDRRVEDGIDVVPLETKQKVPDAGTPYVDIDGHGTAVASIAGGKRLGMATKAQIVPVKTTLYRGGGKFPTKSKEKMVKLIQDALKNFKATTPEILASSKVELKKTIVGAIKDFKMTSPKITQDENSLLREDELEEVLDGATEESIDEAINALKMTAPENGDPEIDPSSGDTLHQVIEGAIKDYKTTTSGVTPDGVPLHGTFDDNVLKQAINEALNEAINKAIQAGMHVVLAAGNERRDLKCGEWSRGDWFTVGAIDFKDDLAPFSSHGECVDIYAPGVELVIPAINNKEDYDLDSGTSFAAPLVAGVIAMIGAADPDLAKNPKKMKAKILSIAAKGKIQGLPEESESISKSHNLILQSPVQGVIKLEKRNPGDD